MAERLTRSGMSAEDFAASMYGVEEVEPEAEEAPDDDQVLATGMPVKHYEL